MKVEYQSKDLEHLGIVAGICDKIGLVEVIDEYIKQNEVSFLYRWHCQRLLLESFVPL